MSGSPASNGKNIEYSSISECVVALLKSCYHSERLAKCEKHYSYDARSAKIVPYSRDLPIGIHLRGDWYQEDTEGTIAIGGLEFKRGRKLEFEIELTKDRVIAERFAIPFFRYSVTGWRDEKQAWAIAFSTVKRYNLSSISEYIVFPHMCKGGTIRYTKMLVVAVPKAELEKVEAWFKSKVAELLAPKVEEVKTEVKERSVEEIEEELRKLEEEPKELPLPTTTTTTPTTVPTAVEKDEEVERLRREVEELKEIVEKRFDEWAAKQGLIKVKLVIFKLPTEYLNSETRYAKEGDRIVESKVLTLDPAELRTLRKLFYEVLHDVAYRVDDLWVLRHDADLSELNEVVKEFHEVLARYNITEKRTVRLIDAYMPRDYVIEALKEYIQERKMALNEIRQKLDAVQKLAQKKRLERELTKVLDELVKLEAELKHLSSF